MIKAFCTCKTSFVVNPISRYTLYQIIVKTAQTSKKNMPVHKIHVSPLFSVVFNFRSRYCAYVSVFFLPIGKKLRATFPRTNPIPRKPPSPPMNNIPANNTKSMPTINVTSASNDMLSFTLSRKKPFIAKTRNAATIATPKLTAYFFHTLLSFIVTLRPRSIAIPLLYTALLPRRCNRRNARARLRVTRAYPWNSRARQADCMQCACVAFRRRDRARG